MQFDRRAWRWRAATVVAVLWTVLVAVVVGTSGAQEPQRRGNSRPDEDTTRQLYQRDCAICHGPEGDGTSRGPSLREAGTASVDFYLRTGRMPIDNPVEQTRHRPPFYTEQEIAALVDYTSAFTQGPAIPEVELEPALLGKGGDLFRLHCAVCHQFAGVGGVLIGDKNPPSLHHSTPLEVVEAIRIGPGTMPAWTEEEIPPEDADAIATYVEQALIHARDPGGLALGHYGPWAEGFAAWGVGLGIILVGAFWIGKRT